MLKIAVVLLAIGAVGGLVMAANIFSGKKAPWPLSILHALLGATALILILLNVLNGATGTLTAALVALAVAAVGGFVLASFHVKDTLAPKGLIVIHALVAVAGFLLLLGAVFGSAA
jgi:hypothetical protein